MAGGGEVVGGLQPPAEVPSILMKNFNIYKGVISSIKVLRDDVLES